MITIRTSADFPASANSNRQSALDVAAAVLGITVSLDAERAPNLLRLNRTQAAQFLQNLGYPISANRLAKLAVHAGGPSYRKWGRSVVYDPLILLDWAQSRENVPQSHT